MKISDLSDKAKLDLKSAVMTLGVVVVVGFLIAMIFIRPAEFMALVIVAGILGMVGYFIFKVFTTIRDTLEQVKERKEHEKLVKTRGW